MDPAGTRVAVLPGQSQGEFAEVNFSDPNARFREFELAAIRFHNATWDPEAGVCGVPALCPECIRAEVAA